MPPRGTRYTITVVEKAMHTLGLALYGEHGGCYVMLQDNQNVVFWVQKSGGRPLRILRYLRWDAMIARRRDIWAAIQYIHTTKNVLADLLSRSFTETGEDIEAVLVEFRAEVQKLDLTAVETLVPPQLLAKLLQQNLESCGVEQLEQYATESWGLTDPIPKGEAARQDRLAINALSVVAFQPPSEATSATSEVVCSVWHLEIVAR